MGLQGSLVVVCGIFICSPWDLLLVSRGFFVVAHRIFQLHHARSFLWNVGSLVAACGIFIWDMWDLFSCGMRDVLVEVYGIFVANMGSLLQHAE